MKITKKPCIAIASGKGGVGKSTLTLNLCSALSKTNTVLAIDCDLGLANLDVLLGKVAPYTLQDILCDTASPSDASIEVNPNFYILPSASGTLESIGMDTMAVHLLFRKLSFFMQGFDYTFLDLGASITPITLAFIEHATHAVIVITPEPTSILDAYALIKVLANKKITTTIHIICSMVTNGDTAQELFTALQNNIIYAMPQDTTVYYWGYVEYSPNVLTSVYNQQLFVEQFPEQECTHNIHSIINTIQKHLNTYPYQENTNT